MFEKIKNHLCTNFSKAENKKFIKFLVFRKVIILIFMAGIYLFVVFGHEESQNTLETNGVEESSVKYYPKKALENFGIPTDWEYIWMPKELPEGYAVEIPMDLDVDTIKDVNENVLTVVTMEFSKFTEVILEESEDSSEQFEFVTSGSKEGGDNSTFLYDERYRITKPDFDE